MIGCQETSTVVVKPTAEGASLVFPNLRHVKGKDRIWFHLKCAEAGSAIKIRRGNADGDLLGSCNVPDTKGCFEVVSCELKGISEPDASLCFVFRQATNRLLLDYFTLTPDGRDMARPGTHWDFHNGTQGWSAEGEVSLAWGEGEFVKADAARETPLLSPLFSTGDLDVCKLLLIRLRNASSADTLRIAFTSRAPWQRKQLDCSFLDRNVKTIDIQSNNDEYVDYWVGMTDLPDWSRWLNQLKLTLGGDGYSGSWEISDVMLRAKNDKPRAETYELFIP